MSKLKQSAMDSVGEIKMSANNNQVAGITDKELLTCAAKAAFDRRVFFEYNENGFDSAIHKSWLEEIESGIGFPWNPLANDGDAFQLMVKLSIRVRPYVGNECDFTTVTFDDHDIIILDHNDDALAATRRAIVRAAAEIGKGI